jgi:hypothetical protein
VSNQPGEVGEAIPVEKGEVMIVVHRHAKLICLITSVEKGKKITIKMKIFFWGAPQHTASQQKYKCLQQIGKIQQKEGS